MAVAFLFHKWSHNREGRGGEQNYCHDLNDCCVKTDVVCAKQFGNRVSVGMFHDDNSSDLLVQVAVTKRGRKQNIDNCEGQKTAAEFVNAERKSCEVKDQTFDNRELVRCGNKNGRHRDTHNLHKTRYKSGSNSTEPVSAMKSKGLGKLVKNPTISLKNNDIGQPDRFCSFDFSEKSKLTQDLSSAKEALIC